jgi:hypothetical protein
MTEKPEPQPSLAARTANAFARITIPQAIVVVALIAGAVAALVLLPPDKLEWLKALILGLATLGGVGTVALSSKADDASAETPPAPVRAPRREDSGVRRARGDEDGSIDLGLVAFVIVGSIIVSLLSGCGGALAGQARAAAIATVALEGAHRMSVETTDARSAVCEDEACVLEVHRSMAPVVVAHDAVRSTLVAWVAALEVARLTAEGGDLVAAMVTAAGRLITEWGRLVEAFARVEVVLPPLPDVVLMAGGEP